MATIWFDCAFISGISLRIVIPHFSGTTQIYSQGNGRNRFVDDGRQARQTRRLYNPERQ